MTEDICQQAVSLLDQILDEMKNLGPEYSKHMEEKEFYAFRRLYIMCDRFMSECERIDETLM